MKRIEHALELESLWLKGRCLRQRRSQIAGKWQQNGKVFSRNSLKPKPLSRAKIAEFENFSQAILKATGAKNLKVLYSEIVKTIANFRYKISSYYLESSDFANPQTLLLSASETRDEILKKSKEWMLSLKNHSALPLNLGSYRFDSLVLGPATFGALLHESLGHALEEQGGVERLGKIKCSFDVFDTPGSPSDWGYTPVDDVGHREKAVKLLDGKTGTLRCLGRGNLRAASWMWHPIIRQRVLEVVSRESKFLNAGTHTLLIEEANLGSWDEETQTAELFVTQAKLLKNGVATHQLPNFCFKSSPKVLEHMHTFGDVQTVHPGGGCHKDLQRGLPVSFRAPSALLRVTSESKKYFEIS